MTVAAVAAGRAATCRLVFATTHGQHTELAHSNADGPWRVVRARTAPVCEATLVQTRGGLLDGDRWRVDVRAERGSSVRLRATGATLAHRGATVCRTKLDVRAGAVLSWRAPGVIAMPGARPRLTTIVAVERGGCAAVSELIAVPRPVEVVVRLVVVRDGVTLHEELCRLDRDPRSAWRMESATHLATAVAVGPGSAARARHWNAALRGRGAATSPRPGLVVARALGSSLQELDAALGPLIEDVHGS
jgi:urease accessory protein UreH